MTERSIAMMSVVPSGRMAASADLGKARAQFHRNQPLLGFPSETDYRVQRRVHVEIGVAGGELQHVAQLVVGASEGTVETERNRPVGD